MLLEARNIARHYPGVQALKGVDFAIDAGEIVAVVGENGAGKSTLMKILAGAVRPSAGRLYMDGEAVEFREPLDARQRGVCAIYQELMIVPELSVVENVFLGHLKLRRGLLDWGAMQKAAARLLGRLGFKAPLDARAGALSVAEQQLIEIAKSLSHNSRLLIMDEPTASLAREEVVNLFELARSLKQERIAVILITHHLHEIFEICDRLIVLRDGDHVGAAAIGEIDEQGLVEMMLGRKVNVDKGSARAATATREIVLEARAVTRLPALDNVSIKLHKGEILGIAGLMGAGRTELLRVLCGADQAAAGAVLVNGSLASLSSPREALALGIGLAPEDRKTQGLILSMPIGQNVTLPSLAKHANAWSGLNLNAETEAARLLCEKLHVNYADIKQAVGNLSGGNQQKVVLAKLLGAGVDIYLLDEPTRGIDIGAKEAIFDLIRALAAKGASVIIISSVIEELIRASDRIVCLHLGRVIQDYERDEFDLNRIMLSAMGKRSGAGAAA